MKAVRIVSLSRRVRTCLFMPLLGMLPIAWQVVLEVPPRSEANALGGLHASPNLVPRGAAWTGPRTLGSISPSTVFIARSLGGASEQGSLAGCGTPMYPPSRIPLRSISPSTMSMAQGPPGGVWYQDDGHTLGGRGCAPCWAASWRVQVPFPMRTPGCQGWGVKLGVGGVAPC